MEIWREINQATVVYFPLIDRGTLDFENTPPTFVAADCQFSIDKGAFANTGSTPVHEGNGIYSLDLLAAEVNGQNISITVIDSATKLWEDQAIIVSTYGSASAEHAVNLNDIVRAGLTALPNFAADAAGGLPVSDLGGLDLDAKLANTNEITVARMGALTDWIDGNRLDIILDIIAEDVINIDGIVPSAAGDAMALTAAAVDDVWDEVLTGGTHAVPDSSGRRLRDLQEFGIYEMNAVWIDTVNGSAGTTDFESGTNINTVNSITDANTLAASVGLSRFMISPMSSITFVAAQENQEFSGKNWDLALGGQSISNSYITGADVTGIGTGAVEVHFEHCEMGDCTLAAAHLDDCDISGTIILSAAADYFFINCNHAGGTAIIDFGAGVLNTTVHVHGFKGAITIENMGQMGTDVLHFDSPGGQLTLAASCIGGTVNMNGTFNFVNNGSGMTINDTGAIIEAVGVAGVALTDLGGMSTAMQAEVLVEVNAALDASISELTQTQPTATPSIRTGLMLMYMAMRNKLDVQTSGTDALEIHNAAGTMIARKLLTDAGGDYSEALMMAGV